jgi:hypothetical protein
MNEISIFVNENISFVASRQTAEKLKQYVDDFISLHIADDFLELHSFTKTFQN